MLLQVFLKRFGDILYGEIFGWRSACGGERCPQVYRGGRLKYAMGVS